ncbi:MAG: nucleotidyltransferase domain-containing protein [Phycisphaerales bacterium]|nr:nucleotidyltransferase domain-containing protein [Phycisphaerales bacterium]
MIDQQTLDTAGRLLVDASPPGSGVILFGSNARGDAGADSDADFLVIEPEIIDKHREMVRLLEVLRPLRVPADVLVTTREQFRFWRDTPNTVYFHAAREGRRYGSIP